MDVLKHLVYQRAEIISTFSSMLEILCLSQMNINLSIINILNLPGQKNPAECTVGRNAGSKRSRRTNQNYIHSFQDTEEFRAQNEQKNHMATPEKVSL